MKRYEKDFFEGMSSSSVHDFSGKIFETSKGSAALNGASKRYKYTEIGVKGLRKTIRILDYHDFKSDEECLALLQPKEILDLLGAISDLSFEKGIHSGRDKLRHEIKGLLGVR